MKLIFMCVSWSDRRPWASACPPAGSYGVKGSEIIYICKEIIGYTGGTTKGIAIKGIAVVDTFL